MNKFEIFLGNKKLLHRLDFKAYSKEFVLTSTISMVNPSKYTGAVAEDPNIACYG